MSGQEFTTSQEVKIRINPDGTTDSPSLLTTDSKTEAKGYGIPSTDGNKHDTQESEKSSGVLTNVSDNPYVVSTAPSVDLQIPLEDRIVPKPWGKIKHVIIGTYLSLLCCCVCAAFGNKYAWEAKRYKDLGLRSEARVLAKNAVCCIYTSVIIGSVIILTFGTTFLVVYIQRNF